MLPCLLVPAIVFAYSERLSRPAALGAIHLSLDALTVRLGQVEKANDTVVEATHQHEATVDFEHSGVAARRLALNLLQSLEC